MTTFGVRAPATPASHVKRGTRLLAWLLPLLAADTYTVFPDNGSWLLVIATAGAAVAMPRLTARLVPFALFAYGAYGIWLTHQMISYEGPFTRFPSGGAPDGIIVVTRNVIYGVVRMGSYDNTAYSLAQAVIFLAAGVLLLAVTGAPGGSLVRRAAQQLRGAGAQPKTVPPLLILPVLLLCEELFSNRLWFGTAVNANIAGRLVAILIVAGGVILAVRLPRQAATAAVAGTVLLGITGVLLGLRWVIAYAGFPWHTTVLYGAVPLHTQYSGLFAITQGVALLGAGATLAPRLVTWSGDLELARRAQLLTQRVSRLTQTRSDATEVAVAELRRIERDLHDGAQARLVAVGMSLRAAEELIRSSPEAALALVADARQTSSRALDDLRDLVRGIYPPVLADRGLAEAVRALALDTPLTVDTDISLRGEPPMPVAAAVYFAIAEALTNAVRHSEARTVEISIEHSGEILRAMVTDDGGGGADPSAGTGLAGVERRLATFDGILAVSSPPGGPTIVAIEVPCSLPDTGLPGAGRPGAGRPGSGPAGIVTKGDGEPAGSPT
ncbi:sensor histidine kinase [Trebonia kvetii]|nr:histidine kinase [Trebonia kvetii]